MMRNESDSDNLPQWNHYFGNEIRVIENDVFNSVLSSDFIPHFEPDSTLLLGSNIPDYTENTPKYDDKSKCNQLWDDMDDELELPQFNDMKSEENFSLVFPESTSTSIYKYFEPTNKLYCELDKVVPLTISADKLDEFATYTIRVTPYFTSPQYIQDIVTRCSHHCQSDRTFVNGKNRECNSYFIKVEYPDAEYQMYKKRPSIFVNVKFDANRTAQLQLKYLCLSSCNGGCNRRDVAVVIEIWNESSRTLKGRLSYNVRVCASPSRDYKNAMKRMKRSMKTPERTIQEPTVVKTEGDYYFLKIRGKDLYEKTKSFYEGQLVLSRLDPDLFDELKKD